jgi:hypothetical protein
LGAQGWQQRPDKFARAEKVGFENIFELTESTARFASAGL